MTAPSHIIERVGDTYPWFADRTMCGVKTSKPEALPFTGSQAVQVHIDGCDPPWCPECFALWAASDVAEGRLFAA